MKVIRIIAAVLTFAIVAGLLWYWNLRLNTIHSEMVLQVLAPETASESIPVYRQFIVTETLSIPRASTVDQIVLPIMATEESLPLLVKLSADDKRIASWTVIPNATPTTKSDVRYVHLNLGYVASVQEKLQLVISGPDVPFTEQEKIPRLLVEKAGEQYPFASYMIAENPKKGAIGVALYHDRSGWDHLRENYSTSPISVIAIIALCLTGIFLLASLPEVIFRSLEYSSQDTNERK